MTGKDKATIYATMRSRILKLLHAKSASDFDGRKVHYEKEHLIMHHEVCHYLELSVISYNFNILDFSQTDKEPTAIHSPVLGKTSSTRSLYSIAVMTY